MSDEYVDEFTDDGPTLEQVTVRAASEGDHPAPPVVDEVEEHAGEDEGDDDELA